MGAPSNRTLEYRHILEPTKEIIKYIDDRRKLRSVSLKTRWGKLNNTCNGGIEPNIIMSIGAISGAGKSAFAGQLETDLVELNNKEDLVILSFNFEMIGSKVIGRKLSNKLNKPVQDLYSGKIIDDKVITLDDSDYEQVIIESSKIKNYPIYYVDHSGTVDQINETINTFREEISKDKFLVIMIDHTLLVNGKAGESEREIISSLQKMFMRQKKIGKTSIIQLTQLNREIENSDRLSNPNLHFPTRKDIFASDSVYHASDYVIILHRPELLQLKTYGPQHWDTNGVIYCHILKNRDGESKILQFKNELQFGRIIDIN
jgi:replicative DNA helicase